jgi:hypothetical protein
MFFTSLLNYIKANKLFVCLLIVISIVSVFLFRIIINYSIGDSPIHAAFLDIYIPNHSLPCNFLYYLLLWGGSLFLSISPFQASIWVLALIHVFKYITIRQLVLYIHGREFSGSFHKAIFEFGCFFLVFVFSLWPLGFNEQIYIGTIPPNTWHNSTSLLMTPFAIALLIYSDKYLQSYNWRLLPVLLLICLLNLAAKPSFFHSFILIFPFLILWKYKLTTPTWLIGVVLLIAVIFAFIQYLWLKHDAVLELYVYKGAEQSTIAIQPFAVWRCWTNNFSLALFRSVAYPFIFSLFYFRKAYFTRMGVWVLLIFIVSLLYFILIVETGPRFAHGNFMWQSIFACLLLFVFTFSVHLKELSLRFFRLKWFDIIIIIIFFLHLTSGILYLKKMILTQNIY